MTDKPDSAGAGNTAPDKPFGAVLPWVLFVSFVFVVNYLTRAFFGPLLPGIEDEFAITHAASTRFLFYMSIGYTASMLLSGPACAVIKPRVLVAASLIFGGLVFQLMAIAHSIVVLSLLFVVFGLMSGQYFNAGMSVLRSLVRQNQWSKAVSVHELGPNVGFLLAPLAAEFGSTHFGWRGTVSYMGWMSVAAGLAFFFFSRGGDEPVGGSVSLKRMATVARKRTLWLFAWFVGLAIAGQFAPFSILSMHMVEERALSSDTAALLVSLSRLSMPFGALIGGVLSARFGTRKTLIACFSIYALSLFAMGLPFLTPFIIGMFVQPLFTAMAFPALFTMVAEVFPLRRQPIALGLGVPAGSFFGIGVMPGILGLFGDHVGFAAGFLAMGAIAAASLFLLRFVPVYDETMHD
ncbi:MAG: MFS transporter [Deltaproteobacteria bacterium]|nr:MFS transporter [Deltaproteobacteria bacterium]